VGGVPIAALEQDESAAFHLGFGFGFLGKGDRVSVMAAADVAL
jgi:hypothetical protein